ncbi:MAG: hypothetical protein ACYC6Y_19695 [Thermoguttaceae bacterium]
MGRFHQFVSTQLEDCRITEAEVPLIAAEIHRDGRLDLDDVKLLVDLYCGARQHCPSFESLFFDVLEQVLLDDGEILPSEQYYLLKMLYSDRVVREPEKQFLVRIRERASSISPEFAALCNEAMDAKSGAFRVGDA